VSLIDSFEFGKAVMISLTVGNPIDQYYCRFNNLGDDAKCACLPGMRGRTVTWDDEITDSKGLFLDSHWGLCPVDKKIWRVKLNLWLIFMLLGLSYTYLTYSKLNLLDRLDGV